MKAKIVCVCNMNFLVSVVHQSNQSSQVTAIFWWHSIFHYSESIGNLLSQKKRRISHAIMHAGRPSNWPSKQMLWLDAMAISYAVVAKTNCAKLPVPILFMSTNFFSRNQAPASLDAWTLILCILFSVFYYSFFFLVEIINIKCEVDMNAIGGGGGVWNTFTAFRRFSVFSHHTFLMVLI